MSASSADGLQWKTRGEPWFRKEHNSNLLGWDEPCGSYVLFPRLHLDGHQGVGRSESPDFETWSEVEPLIHPGPTESHLQFKGMAAFPNYGVYIGMLWVFVGSPRKSHAELTFSRDGLHWHRPFPGIPFFDRGPEAAWDCENVLPVAPIIHGESIRIYYSGWNLPYTIDAMQRAQNGWIENGAVMERAIGFATLPMDRFVSLRSAGAGSELITKPFIYGKGNDLFLNTRVSGSLRTALLDESGGPHSGHTMAESRLVRGDSLAHPLKWKGSNAAQLAGREVALHIALDRGDLFSVHSGG